MTAISRALKRSPLALLLLLTISAPSAPAAPSIFDDEWKPPTRNTSTQTPDPTSTRRRTTQPPTTTPPTTTPPTESTPTPTPPDRQPPPTSTPQKPTRLPVPSTADIAKSRAQLKELFAAKMADKSMPGRRALAQALLDAVPRTADNVSDQYVLLGGAVNAAREGASARLCFAAADQMARLFEVDPLPIKAHAATVMSLRADSPAIASENAREGLDLVDALVAADDLTTASRLCALLRPITPADSTLAPVLAARVKEIDALRVLRDRVAAQTARLKTTPDDPAANLFVGSYYCFTRGDWERGLPMLAKGTDAELKKLAADDLANAAKDDAVGRLGDAWFKFGERQPESLRTKTWQRASAFYTRELAAATGLRRSLIEKRIATAPVADEPGRVNLSALLGRTGANAVKGAPKLENGVLTADDGKNLLVEFPYAPPEEYDYAVTFRAVTSGEFLQVQPCPGGAQFSWRLGAFTNKWAWFERLEGGTYGRFSEQHRDAWMETGERYTSTIKVRRDGVEAYLNDQRVAAFKTDWKGVSLLPNLKLSRTDTLGLQCPPGFEIESASVLEITGGGKILQRLK